VPAPRDARPAAADQAAHDVLASLYPAATSSVDQLLAAELGAIPDGQGKRDGIRVGATVARLLVGLRARDGSAGNGRCHQMAVIDTSADGASRSCEPPDIGRNPRSAGPARP